MEVVTHDPVGRAARKLDPREGKRRPRSRVPATAVAGVIALLLSAGSALAMTLARAAAGKLAFSTASAYAVQSQPPAGSCHARGTGVYSHPYRRCTPGALNPAVSQSTIARPICRRGWSGTVRPPGSITAREKRLSMRAYGERSPASSYEYDHLVALSLGGAVNDRRNLWPEPDYANPSGFYLNPKDRLEQSLHRMVCAGSMRLSQAQSLLASDWVAAFRRYG